MDARGAQKVGLKQFKLNQNKMEIKKYLVHIVWFVVVVVAFVGGMYYGKSTAAPAAFGARGGAFSSSTRNGAGARNGMGGGFVAGQVASKDAQSLTIQLANGNSEVVFYSSSTSIIKPSPASINDITPGTNVTIGGAQNADGSVTAQTIQVRVAGSGPGFGGGAGRGGNATSGQ